jgi:hypothetical protein
MLELLAPLQQISDRTDVAIISAPADKRNVVAVCRRCRLPGGEEVENEVGAAGANAIEHLALLKQVDVRTGTGTLIL